MVKLCVLSMVISNYFYCKDVLGFTEKFWTSCALKNNNLGLAMTLKLSKMTY